MQQIYRLVVKFVTSPVGQAYLDVIGMKAAGAGEGAAAGAARGAEEGAANGAVKGAEQAASGTAKGAEQGATSGATKGAESAATPKEGIYEGPDATAAGKTYVGQSGNIPSRLAQHQASGKFPDCPT